MSIRARVARLRQLTWLEWKLLVLTCFLQFLTALALRFMPLATVRVQSIRLRRWATAVAHAADSQVIWAIEASGRRMAGMSTCLVRALVADLVLGTANRPLSLRIGVKRTDQGALLSHAWLFDGHRILIGADEAADFLPLVEWNSLSA